MNKPIELAAAKAEDAKSSIRQVVHGQEQAVDLLFVALACGGHALLEGVPGVGKTTLAKTFAAASGLTFKRVQLTPDLMPTDITGHSFYNQATHSFEVREGPAFTNILLADEINRAPPRTQSALLEVMEEKHVTIEGTTRPVPEPFLVIATKNPIDIEGVYPLPEAQLDRFMLFIDMGYPPKSVEANMLLGKLRGVQPASATKDLVPALRAGLAQVSVHADIVDYVLNITRATRDMKATVELGAGPRASEHLLAAARACALFDRRDFVLPDDVKTMAPHVLSHRLILAADADIAGLRKADVVAQVLDATPVPIEVAEAR